MPGQTAELRYCAVDNVKPFCKGAAMKVFLAGATGAIGKQLGPLLLEGL